MSGKDHCHDYVRGSIRMSCVGARLVWLLRPVGTLSVPGARSIGSPASWVCIQNALRTWVKRVEIDGGLRAGMRVRMLSGSRSWRKRTASFVGLTKFCVKRARIAPRRSRAADKGVSMGSSTRTEQSTGSVSICEQLALAGVQVAPSAYWARKSRPVVGAKQA